MKMKSIKSVQLILVTLIWVLIFAMPLLFGESEHGINWPNIVKIWKEYSLLMMIFLVNRFVLMPFLFLKGRRFYYFASIAGIIIVASLIIYLSDDKGNDRLPLRPRPTALAQRHEPPPPFKQQKPFIPAYGNLLIMGVLLIGFDSGLLFFSKWMLSEQKKLKAEKESIGNKIAFLQSQVSPHFFMNTLNNIHALIDINTEEAKEAIIQLSRMMDYMLYESNASQISLKQEMDFIKSYVELMNLRLTDDVDLILDIPDELPSITIPPLLTIAYIENAFKYGISYEEPSHIHIRVKWDKDRIYFHIDNSINQHRIRNTNHGLGLENTKRRLDLLFGHSYQLDILHENSRFVVDLNFHI